MAADIRNHIRKECRCLVNKAPNIKEKAPLVPIEATYPFQMVSIDYMELDPCKGNYRYVLVVTDHFTRFCQIYATKTKSSKAAADKIFNQFIVQYGYPERIHHDQGGEFNSKLFHELHRLTGIRSSQTTPYHPEGDGQTERLNRTVKNMLKSLEKAEKRDWKSHLSKLAFAYNSTKNKSTGYSPHFLMFGRESRLPIDTVFQEVREEERLKDMSHEQFVQQWQKSMQEAVGIARENIGKSSEYNRKYYNNKVKAVEIIVGDKVLVKNVRARGGTGKLRSYWEEALFKVVEKRDGVPVYKIKNMKKASDVRVVHRNLLMKCDQLPEDIFEVPTQPKKGKSKKKRTVKPRQKEEIETVAREDSDSDDNVVIVHHYTEEIPTPTEEILTPTEENEIELSTSVNGREERSSVSVEENEQEVRNDERVEPSRGEETTELSSEPVEERNEEEMEERSEGVDEETDAEGTDVQDTEVDEVDESDESSSSNSDDESTYRRQSTRTRLKTARITYDEMGGDPKYERS